MVLDCVKVEHRYPHGVKLKWVNVTPLQRGARTPNGGAVFGSRLRIVRVVAHRRNGGRKELGNRHGRDRVRVKIDSFAVE